MTLTPGTRLGPYQVLAAIGAGGMGEVYRARDTRLGRTVAIKVLPEGFSGEADRRERFEREARAISALTHPHICTLYDVGSHAGIDFLVMEHLEGETLAQRLKRGALPLEQTLRIGREISDALDRAHQSGIVHRDLKPGNIMLTASGAKLLDFGLAKRTAVELQGSVAPTAATASEPLTMAGGIVGTLGYMAPEQLEGKEADERSDLFALGVVLYEMLSGERPFDEGSSAGLIAAVLTKEPVPLSSRDLATPPILSDLVHACLAKDPMNRWQSVADLRRALSWAGAYQAAGASTGRSVRAAPWVWIGVAAALGVTLGAVAIWLSRGAAPNPSPPSRFAITLPANESLHEYASSSLAISADGKLLAYVANRDDTRGIYLRPLDRLEPRLLAGTEGGTNPFFSPDGRWMGFVVGNSVRKISLDGGAAQTLADAPYFTGATWLPDNTIVFAPVFTSGLFRVPAKGGKPAHLTTPDTANGEWGHFWPYALPGGKALLFTIWKGTTLDQADIGVLVPGTGERHTLIQGGFHPRYSPSGHIVFVRGSTLMAAPFDPVGLVVTGPVVPALEGVRGDAASGAIQFAIAPDGTLVYGPGRVQPGPRTLVWVDRDGDETPVAEMVRPFLSARLSPDGGRLALSIEEASSNIWVYEVARGTLSRVTFGTDDHSVSWSPDGRRIAFESCRDGQHQIYAAPSDGSGEAVRITNRGYEHYGADWSPDGRFVVHTEFHSDTGADLWYVDAGGEHTSHPYLVTKFSECKAAFSPDGKWLAYVSNETGQDEVYIKGFPEGDRLQVSLGGGNDPAWAPSGREVFYRKGGQMLSVPLTGTGTPTAGKPSLLFRGLYFYNVMSSRSYGVTPDSRFVMVKEPSGEAAAREIDVILNWGGTLASLAR